MGNTDPRYISSGSGFEQQIGYSRAVISGDFVFVSGTTGFDYAANTLGYTDGLIIEYDDHWWTARFAEALMPKVAPISGYRNPSIRKNRQRFCCSDKPSTAR